MRDWYNNRSVRSKISMIGVVGIIGFMLYWAYNFTVSSQNANRLQRLGDVIYPILERTDRTIVRLGEIRADLENAAGMAEEEYLENAQEKSDILTQTLSELSELDPSSATAISNLQTYFDAYFSIGFTLSEGMINDEFSGDELRAKAAELNLAYETIETNLASFRAQRYQDFKTVISETDSSLQNALALGGGILVVVILMLGSITYFIVSSISSNLRNVIDSLHNMANGNGDLSQRLSSQNNDEIGELVGCFNAFIGKLQIIIQQVSSSAIHLGSATQQMSETASKNDRHIEHQMSETSEVVQAIDRSMQSGTEISKHIQNAADVVRSANTEAGSSQQIVVMAVHAIESLANQIRESSTAMQDVLSNSNEISSVLDVIQEVTEQTNLLALNAAIEAARAGEFGRGFAVVADEVRTLATRTTNSTSQIRSTIDNLQQGVRYTADIMEKGSSIADSSVTQANMAGDALNQIINAVAALTNLMDDISSQAQAQSQVTDNLRQNVQNISSASQDTASGSQQIAQASHSLESMAVDLRDLVGQFKC